MFSLYLLLISFLMPIQDPTSLNRSSLVTHLHLKSIRSVGAEILTRIIKPCQTKSYRSHQIDEWILRKETSACCPILHVTRRWMMSGILTLRPPGSPNARQGYATPPATLSCKQETFRDAVVPFVVVTPAGMEDVSSSQGSSGKVDYTRDNTADTVIDPGTVGMA